jgi:hypothetical protein
VKHSVTRFKSLGVGLKELERFVRDPEHLVTGKPLKGLKGMRPREAWANWLLCAAINFDWQAERLSFTSDPTGSDGKIYDARTQTSRQTEHILVPRPRTLEDAQLAEAIGTRILKAVAKKQAKGAAAYAQGKELVVFLDVGGAAWFPNRVARQLPVPMDFNAVWVVALQRAESGDYLYAVTRLNATDGDAPIWLIRIAKDFNSWTVTRIQWVNCRVAA